MAGDDLRKVRSGERLNIPAAAYNAFVDAARMARGMNAAAGTPQWRHNELVTVKNISGSDQDRFYVLGIGGPIFTPTDNLDEFCDYVGLEVTTPTSAHCGRFVVLAEPIAASGIGAAWASGICPVRVMPTADTGDDRFADIDAGEVLHLKACPTGAASSAEILWIDPVANGVRWAIIRIGPPTVPRHGIIMWSGGVDEAPSGWTLCDGGDDSRGVATPDLRGRFIVARDTRVTPPDWSDTNYDTIGNTGGLKEHPLDAIADGWAYSDPLYVRGEAVADQSFDNRPPYYVLAFIRKD